MYDRKESKKQQKKQQKHTYKTSFEVWGHVQLNKQTHF